MFALPQPAMTPEEYLRLERASAIKHEYSAGEVFAMTGATENHNLIVMNTGASLHAQLRSRPCRVYPSDMRVRTSPAHYHYPDTAVVCGDSHFEDDQLDTLLNPTLIVEVLSPSTEAYDRGRKFEHYRALPSLQEYLLIAQERASIDHFRRHAGQWLLASASRPDEALALPSVGCTLAVVDVYEKVSFGAGAAPP